MRKSVGSKATVIDDMHKLGEFRQQVAAHCVSGHVSPKNPKPYRLAWWPSIPKVKNVFVQPGAETCELKDLEVPAAKPARLLQSAMLLVLYCTVGCTLPDYIMLTTV